EKRPNEQGEINQSYLPCQPDFPKKTKNPSLAYLRWFPGACVLQSSSHRTLRKSLITDRLRWKRGAKFLRINGCSYGIEQLSECAFIELPDLGARISGHGLFGQELIAVS